MDHNTHGKDDKEHRAAKPTEKMEAYHTGIRDNIIKKLHTGEIILKENLDGFTTFPKSYQALESMEKSVTTAYERYNAIANDYLDFLSRSPVPEDTNEAERYWPIMSKYRTICFKLFDEIAVVKEGFKVKSQRSSRASHVSNGSQKSSSHVSSSSRVSSLAISKRAKAESEKIKLQFLEQENQLKKEQFEKTLQLQALEQHKIALAAEVEASSLEKQIDSMNMLGDPLPLPKDEISSHDRTVHYVDQVTNQTQDIKPLSAKAAPFVPANLMNNTTVISSNPMTISEPKQQTKSTSNISTNLNYTPVHLNKNTADPSGLVCTKSSDIQTGHSGVPVFTRSSDTHTFSNDLPVPPKLSIGDHSNADRKPRDGMPGSNETDITNFMLKKNLLLESFQQQQFGDRPDRFVVWKTQFKSLTSEIKCSPLEEITLMTSCIQKDSEAHRLIMSTRASCASDPELCLDNIWKRLNERFGSAELLEASLKSRLSRIPDFTDRRKLYELYDLLCEIEAVKGIAEYSVTFAYLDSSIGIKPIIQKLPKYMQEKWVTRVVNYKHRYQVLFPPFSELVQFVGEMSAIRNDPGLMYDIPNESKPQTRSRNIPKTNTKQAVSAHKTDVTPNTEANRKHPCLIHKNSKHTINYCRAFRTKSMEERIGLFRSNNICLHCGESSSHFAKSCPNKVECFVCKSNKHCTALHSGPEPISQATDNPPPVHGEEPVNQPGASKPSVNVKCTDICGEFSGKSCARILPVRIFREGQKQKCITAYAMLDDQSNKTLGKSHLFDNLSIDSKPVEYSMQSCSGRTVHRGRIGHGLVVEGIDESIQLKLPPIIECDNIPDSHAEIPTPNIARHYSHMSDIVDEIHDIDPSMNILLLIGRDLPEAHHVLDQRTGPVRSPFAQRSPLGWTIIGDVCLSGQHLPSTHNINKTFISENGRPSLLEPCHQVVNINNDSVSAFKTQVVGLNIFGTTPEDNKPGLSVEDREFIRIMDNNFHIGPEGKWMAPLPFRTPKDPLPDNYPLALRRAKSLDASLHKDEKKREHFLTFMQGILDNHHAEIAPYLPPDQERWYLPLFGVYHPRKPDKIRGVFDSSAKFEGTCLNDQPMQGPDLLNNLLGILIRFRKEMIGVVGDIEQMFHSFLVDEDHRNYLRFLWHKDNVLDNPLAIYRMRAHVFGNKPSPSIAMYGLRRIGELAGETHGHEVKDFITNHFYVDDGLKSCASNHEAIELLKKTQDAMKTYGNVRLHKFASNSKTVMEAFQSSDLAKDIVDLDFEKDVPTQRSLGLLWDLQTDTFKFNISNADKPATRRGILSVVNSLYDPLGFISPITITGKIILRKVVSSTVDWDEPLTGQVIEEWNSWRSNLPEVETLRIPRVIVPNLSQSDNKELLIYCDASELAIAAVCYLRVTYKDSTTSTGFVLGKAKVAPVSGHTIPRLELCAAVLATEVAQLAIDHLQIEFDSVRYFSDSRVVLGYINNDKKRFFTYVANRVARIRSVSNPSQWFYVRSEMNPADSSTRESHTSHMEGSSWLTGPKSVSDISTTCKQAHELIDPDSDKEVRVNKLDVKPEPQFFDNGIFSRFSSFDRLITGMVTIRRFIQRWRKSKHKDFDEIKGSNLLCDTEWFVIREVQRKMYSEDYECILQSKPLSKNSPISRLDPYIDTQGIIRVGGRIKHADTDIGVTNPIILPAKHHITLLIVRKYHESCQHQGRHLTEGQIRTAGFWIVGGKRLISTVIRGCVVCRKLRRNPQSQKMSSLPIDRVTPGQPPFTSVGVDMFGPFEVVARRTRGGVANSKRWGALFTCLVTRAVHLEIVEEMSTSSFINAMRRFIAIRGHVSVFRSDRGTNFVGTVNELRLNAVNIEDGPIQNFLEQHRTSWIFNLPHASHMGGVWERMIGVTRRILEAMLLQHKSCLTHEVLSTFFAEVSHIINSRPLVSVSTDPDNPTVLSPLVLLTQKTDDQNYGPVNIDSIDRNDLLRKHWKRVQHLAAIFWKRYKTEYLNTLQSRRKWNVAQRNVAVGDIVLLRDKELPRNSWPMGLVTKVTLGNDNLVRTVVVKVTVNGSTKTFCRPITEVIVLLEQ